MQALKACPNCGGIGKITHYIDKFDGSTCGYHVVCQTCGAMTYVCACEQPAIDDWNSGYLIVRC